MLHCVQARFLASNVSLAITYGVWHSLNSLPSHGCQNNTRKCCSYIVSLVELWCSSWHCAYTLSLMELYCTIDVHFVGTVLMSCI